MSGVRVYLLRIVACGFLVSIAGLIPIPKGAQRALRLCCGCLMILTVLRPLIGLDLSSFSDQLFHLAPEESLTQEQAKEANDALLQRLIREQTEALLQKKTRELGAMAEFRVELRRDEAAGVWIPWAVEIRGTFDAKQRAALSDYLEQALNIAAERQRWLLP